MINIFLYFILKNYSIYSDIDFKYQCGAKNNQETEDNKKIFPFLSSDSFPSN